MDAKILQIILRAKDEATKTIGNVEKAVNSSQRTIDKMAGTMKIAGAAITTASVASAYAINNMAQSGGRLYDLENSFEKLAKGAGTSMDTLLSELQEATAGTIENSALIENSVRAAMLGLPIEKMSGLFKIARQQSVAMGEDMGYMLDSIVKGIGRASPMILDNLGITISLGEVYEDAAKKLGKKTDELTKAEQQQALTNAVLEWGAQKEEELGGAVTSNVDSYKRMEAAIKNVKDQLSKYYFDTLAPVIEGIGNLAEKINSVNPDILKFAATFTVAMTGIGLIVGPILLLIGFLPALAAGAAILGTTLGVVVGIALAVVAAVTLLVAGFVAYKQNLFGFKDAVDNIFMNIKNFILNTIEAVKTRLSEWGELFRSVGDLIKSKIDNIILGFMTFRENLINTVQSVIEFVAGVIETFSPLWNFFSELFGFIGSVIMAFITIQQIMFENLVAIVGGIFEFISKIVMDYVNDQIEKWTRIWNFTKEVLSIIWNTIKETWETIKAVTEAVWNVIVSIFEWVWSIIGDDVIAGVEFVKSIISSGWDLVVGLFDSLRTRATDTVTGMWDTIKQMFNDAKESVLTTITNMADGIVNILKNMKLPRIKIEVEEKEIGGIKLKIPHLSMYQFGGMVPSSGLAYLHSGEFVMSRGMVEGRRAMPPSVNNSYQQPITINVNGADGVDVGQLGYTLAWQLRNSR